MTKSKIKNNSENIILIGMMGSGKSTVGRLLAKLLDEYTFIDSDKEIERITGATISNLFLSKGEHYFRELESKVLREINTQKIILASGGGMPFHNNNWDVLSKLGTTFFLNQSLKQLLINCKKSTAKRPLYNEATFIKILEERTPIFQKSNYIIDCFGLKPSEIADVIFRLHQSV